MDDYEEMLGKLILPLFTQKINSRDFILLVHKHNPMVLTLNEVERLTKEMDFKPNVDVNLNILLMMRHYPGWFQCILDVCGDPLMKKIWLKIEFEKIKRQLDESLNGQAPAAQASVAAPAAEGDRVTTRQGASSMATLETDNVISFYNNGATCENREDINDQRSMSSKNPADSEIINRTASMELEEKSKYFKEEKRSSLEQEKERPWFLSWFLSLFSKKQTGGKFQEGTGNSKENEKLGLQRRHSERDAENYREGYPGPENKKSKKEKQEAYYTTVTSYFSTEQRGKSKERKKWSPAWKDTDNYRNGYPGKVDNPRWKDNLKFYTGKIRCSPDGDYIDSIHKHWWGDYNLLERHNGYIQWIFPIREEDETNRQSQPLQKQEAEAIKADPKAHARVLTSYKMMLDFYGMRLVNDKTGKLTRTDRYEDRYDNLNWSGHNYTRITRILKSLGELGYEHLKKGFIQFVLEEALIRETLKRTFKSCKDDWIGTIKDEEDRDELYQYIEDNTA